MKTNLFTNKLMWLGLTMFLLNGLIIAQINLTYKLPPKEIVELVDAELTPSVSVNPTSDKMLLLERPSMPSIEDIASDELRLGGIRIDPKTNGPSRSRYNTNIKILNIDGTNEISLKGLPPNLKIRNVSWSPDGKKFAFTNTISDGIELWMAYVESGEASRLTAGILNNAIGRTYIWSSDSKTLVFKSILKDRGAPPQKPFVPAGPVIQENIGTTAAVRTYQDLLTNSYDESLFKYFTQSQLILITLDKESKKLGNPGIISSFNSSPNGNYLLVQIVKHPFSYIVPYRRFPLSIEIWDKNGNLVKKVADIPLSESIPKGFGSVRKGPRSFTWRSDVPAAVYWVEAQDEGDPKNKVEIRDQIFYLEAPFTGNPKKSVNTNLRYSRITWGNENLAIIYENWRKTRKSVTSFFNPSGTEASRKVIFDISSEDRYNDPGRFVTTTNENGKRVLMLADKGKSLYLTGSGASPEGNRPFVDKFDIETYKTNRLWRSEAPYYESPYGFIDVKKGIILTSRQSKEEPANYFLRNLKNKKLTQVTHFPNPSPQLKNVQKQLIKYERKDGVQLTAELYLPAGYKVEDGPLPTLMWAYPREYKSADAAGQVSGSPHTFIRISPTSALLWITQGYAIVNNAAFPIVGEGDTEPNDGFREQLVANAEAVIDKVVSMGVSDRDRIAVGGHSYGAFMTANLLAHSDLFAAGIARSGAYNRTLTPFGFQAEPRTYWEAPDVYYNMSPFMHADKVKTPILLIHGIADNNSGTFPIQSERFYNALKGHGATTRLVMLPHESHGYRARESVMHMLWETTEWLNKYVKK